MVLANFARVRRGLIALLILLTIAPAVSAQSIIDARRVEFTPSADNNAVDPTTGAALVTNYTLDVYPAGGATKASSANLAKPTPDVDGMMRLDFVALLTTALTPGAVYESVLSAVGPGGTAPSARSNTFAFSAPCTYTISPTSSNLPSSIAASGNITVTAGAGCNWTAVSNVGWVTIGAGASGTGNGNVTYNVAANTSTSPRTGTLTIAGNTFGITQPGALCTFTILPSSVNLSSAIATSGTVTVTAGAGCTWTASSNAAWITLTAGTSGNGNGTVSYNVAANTGTASRTGHGDHRRPDVHRQSGGSRVHVLDCPALRQPHLVGRHDGHGRGHGERRLRLDRDDEYGLAVGDRRREWYRQRHRHLQRRRQHRSRFADGHAHDRGQHVHRESARRPVHLHDYPDVNEPRVIGGDDRHRDGQRRQRLQLDGGRERSLVDDYVRIDRQRGRVGKL